MQQYQQQFVELALNKGALKFGEFKLKSGRVSPYFFNAGEFCTGKALSILGRCYAEAIVQAGIGFDVLFGPAYKGIPLVASVAVALAEHFGQDVPYCFNRKEAKTHGEGGNLVGAELSGKVLIIDDVITAGTAIRESVELIQAVGADISGVVVGLDRKEKGVAEESAVQEIERVYDISVTSIIEIQTIIEYLKVFGKEPGLVDAITQYRESYGV